jgi:hypothetical protein
LENRKGRIAALADILSKENINLIELFIADTTEFGIVRLITDDNERALKVLKENGFTVTSNNLIGVEVADAPGGLSSILAAFEADGIDIEYLYSFSRKEAGRAFILVKVADNEVALKTLAKHKIKLFKAF